MAENSQSQRIRQLYLVFSRYSYAGRDFCTFCHTDDEIRRFTQTPVDRLTEEDGRNLLCHTEHHWESADVYRHYLPRLLELLGPPWLLENIYSLPLFETLIGMNFRQWPRQEQDAVSDYLEHIGNEVTSRFNEEEFDEWSAGIARLKNPALALPTESEKHYLNDRQRALAEYMSVLSEEAYSTGWKEGLEHALWGAVLNGPRKYGQLFIQDQHIAELRRLSEECGGWIYFHENRGETWVSISNWKLCYDPYQVR